MADTATKNDLVTFAGPIFDLILRLKAGIVAPSNDLRPKFALMLDDFEKRAERYRFNHKVIAVAKFALASFVDETILTNNFPLRSEWEKNPLQLEYFGEQLAGNKFFDKLEAMLRQIEVTQDAVEIYYLCMLLGFKGRYGVYEQEKLLSIMESTAKGLVKIGKIKSVELAPNWLKTDQPEIPRRRGMPTWAKIGAFACLGIAFIVYLVMFVYASKMMQDTMSSLQFGG
ncbi:MAG: type IVB secretion system protein IcmH/DotU [Acidobacteria bacterium]|nr:type IVB secretion system protein IcmH/DotU [Acidobacteriota bacterium]MCW5947877.1 type IVB secretion system protein IcmH/DotU [Pyrinomonadaceae bacterium]